MAEDNRLNRDQATREKKVAKRSWEAPEVLPMPDERREYYEGITKAQMDAVDNNLMRENDARMPIFNDRKSNVTFGKG